MIPEKLISNMLDISHISYYVKSIFNNDQRKTEPQFCFIHTQKFISMNIFPNWVTSDEILPIL